METVSEACSGKSVTCKLLQNVTNNNNLFYHSTGNCTCSDITLTGSAGNLGACKNQDSTGKYFTYVKKEESGACCESNTVRFTNQCINYSLCDCEKYPDICCGSIGNSRRTSFSED